MISNVYSRKWVSGIGAATNLRLFWDVPFGARGLPPIYKRNVWFRTYIVENEFRGSGQQHIYVRFEMYLSGLAPNQQSQRIILNVYSRKWVSGLGVATYLRSFWDVPFRARGLPPINKCNVWIWTYIVKNEFRGSGQQHIYVRFEMYPSGLGACPKSTKATYEFERI